MVLLVLLPTAWTAGAPILRPLAAVLQAGRGCRHWPGPLHWGVPLPEQLFWKIHAGGFFLRASAELVEKGLAAEEVLQGHELECPPLSVVF